MSEAPEAPKKKKSPLPVVLALVLVLAGGGFFMTKGKGEKKEDKSVIKLAKEEVVLEEFLVNMADRNTYLRAKIAIKMMEGFDPTALPANMSAVEDAVIRTLRTVDPDSVRTDAEMVKLKRRLAAAMNRVLAGAGHEEEESSHGKVTQIRKKIEEEELPPDWDSTEGPVLQVFFKTFATQ
ncbi:MAG: flagellar basal body-associated FliL family protein [Fimbriimonas sp.]